MTPPPLPSLHIGAEEELIYRGEGNSSLVIALKSQRKVIRLLKSDAKKLKNDDDNVLTHLLQHIDFNVNILPDIFPGCYFTPPQLFCLNSQIIERIRNLVKDKRPSFRLDKTINHCQYALLMPDYCCIPKLISSFTQTIGPVIAVEIKPKQGFLPPAELFNIDPRLRIKSQICRFGLSQFHKLQKHSIKSISSYCPLDIFSGCPYRTLYALACLIDNPQNNFRVFSDAQLVYGEQAGSVEQLKQVLQLLLSTDNKNGERKPGKQHFELLQNGNTNFDSLSVFCLLILQSLYMPYAVDGRPSENLANSCHDYSNTTNLCQAIEKFDSLKEYVFFRTFVQLFETSSTSATSTLSDTDIGSDINNNQVHGTTNVCTVDANNNGLDSNGNDRSRSPAHCLLHSKTNSKLKTKTKLNYECNCKDSQHTLPVGCVLDSILAAQMLDTLDSVKGVDLFDQLCNRYNELKQTTTAESELTEDSYKQFLETFLSENRVDLNKLWHFLLSLTAKDCSIMISMQRVNQTEISSGATVDEYTLNQSGHLCRFVTNTITGERFVVSVAITDLDYKQAYKIQRMLYNDRRMINVFRAALKTGQSGAKFDQLAGGDL